MHLVEEKVLLLELTDDESPNLSTLSVLASNSDIGRNLLHETISKSPNKRGTTTTTTGTEENRESFVVVDNTICNYQQERQRSEEEDTFNEGNRNSSSNERRFTYKQQFSVPSTLLYRQQSLQQQQQQQPSIPRRRRTSVIIKEDCPRIYEINNHQQETRESILVGCCGTEEIIVGVGGVSPTSKTTTKPIVDGNIINTIVRHQNSETILFNEFLHSNLIASYETTNLLRTNLSSRNIVLRRCEQSEPLDFSIEYSEDNLHYCHKIGEGVYGEVFLNKNKNGEAIVLKIIPIEGSIEINGEQQKKFDEILSEIIIAMELSSLRNDKDFMTSSFVEVKKVRCVQGRYPENLIDLWELYRDNSGTENDHPEIFPDDQLYIVLELANGGQDLEAFNFQNALQSYSAFLQTALTLAIAENKFKFEHRDLHWGNILLAPTEEKEIIFKLNGEEIKIPTHGVKVTIIDYTLSRMVFDGCCLYNDLSNDNELFSATGDYQFDIYRLMKKRLDNDWERYEPYTNILWLHYAIDKMISGARYRCSKTKKHRSAIQTMMQLRDELLDYKSASEYVKCLII